MEKRDRHLGYLLNKATHLIKWELNNQLKEYQLTSAQWAVLADVYLQEAEGDIENSTPAAIAERLKVERSAITRIIEKLIKEEWIMKIENPLDGRSQLICLTAKARETIPQLETVSNDFLMKTFMYLKDDDINQLKNYLSQIIKNLK